MSCRAVRTCLCIGNVSTVLLQFALVTCLFAENDEVVLYIKYRTIRYACQFEDGTVTTCVVVHQGVIRECDIPFWIVHILIFFCQLLFDEGRERTVIEGVFDSLEVCQHIGLAIVASTVNPAVATSTIAVVSAVEEQVVLDKHMVPKLVVRTLLTHKTTNNTLEGTVLHDKRIEGDSHTIAKHVEEIVTRCCSYACFLVTIVETLRVVEVDIIESKFLHVYLTTFTSFR